MLYSYLIILAHNGYFRQPAVTSCQTLFSLNIFYWWISSILYIQIKVRRKKWKEEKYISTIMDKSVGIVVQFERFSRHAKLYPRTTNTAPPYPLPPPHDGQCWNRPGTIPLIFQHCVRWGRGREHGFVKLQHCFFRHYLRNAENWSYALTVLRTFVHDCSNQTVTGTSKTKHSQANVIPNDKHKTNTHKSYYRQ